MTSDRPQDASGERQLLLDFPHADPAGRPLIQSGPYAGATGALARWKLWPGGQMALVGELSAGKSRLLRWWAGQAGAALVSGQELAAASIDEIARLSVSALAVDDADLARGDPAEGGLALLAALNLCRDRQAPVLLSGSSEPAGWFSTPPDLRSRLAAMPVVQIEAPDDATLAARLREDSALRHLNLPEESVAYIAARMERSWAAVARVADQIVRTPGRAEGIRSARAVLAALGQDPG